jgi:hypothetical protein
VPEHPDRDASLPSAAADRNPEWFNTFLEDRQARKPSAHTMKAYRQDFIAVASIVTAVTPYGWP